MCARTSARGQKNEQKYYSTVFRPRLLSYFFFWWKNKTFRPAMGKESGTTTVLPYRCTISLLACSLAPPLGPPLCFRRRLSCPYKILIISTMAMLTVSRLPHFFLLFCYCCWCFVFRYSSTPDIHKGLILLVGVTTAAQRKANFAGGKVQVT